MRIVSGRLKGRRLKAPKQLPVRPTTDMAKEALFNILNNQYYFDELSVLDLFAGTGNISYEFASRGTAEITAVDNHYGCINFIKTTSQELDIGVNALKSDVFSFLNATTKSYDIVFADPPYDLNQEMRPLGIDNGRIGARFLAGQFPQHPIGGRQVTGLSAVALAV